MKGLESYQPTDTIFLSHAPSALNIISHIRSFSAIRIRKKSLYPPSVKPLMHALMKSIDLPI